MFARRWGSLEPWLLAAALGSAAAACVTETNSKELCAEDSSCASDPDCPVEPPSAGRPCSVPEYSVCFYCSGGDRIDASHYECIGGAWTRHANAVCD